MPRQPQDQKGLLARRLSCPALDAYIFGPLTIDGPNFPTLERDNAALWTVSYVCNSTLGLHFTNGALPAVGNKIRQNAE